MGSHQTFQRFALFGQNGHRVGGQSGHGNLLFQLRIRLATTQPIRLLKSVRRGRSQNFRSAVLGREVRRGEHEKETADHPNKGPGDVRSPMPTMHLLLDLHCLSAHGLIPFPHLVWKK